MSRSGREDHREAAPSPTSERVAGPRSGRPVLPADRLILPQSARREAVPGPDRLYRLRGSETRALATVGAFRVVPEADLADPRSGASDTVRGDLQQLARQGLVTRHTIPINRVPTRVVVLTPAGRDLLAAHQREVDGPRQAYYAGLVKPRELAHDAQLYRLFQAEAARLEDAGATVTRVVLDYELKQAYQTFLHRPDRGDDADREAEVEAFAAATRLPVIDGHLELPDLRIEYRTADGALETRDLELVTEHYSRSQLAGKARAGFACYRAAGSRVRGGASRTGGTPFDPHVLERL